jgi:hypothetical protein
MVRIQREQVDADTPGKLARSSLAVGSMLKQFN